MNKFTLKSNQVDDQFIEAIKAHPIASQHYDAIIGSADPLVVVPNELDTIYPLDVPQMGLIAECLSVPGTMMTNRTSYLLGDLYVGTVEGRVALAFHWDYTGLYILTA